VKEHPDGVVVLLVGPLGAGKTVFARGVARGLGIRDQVVSPTYTIISEYPFDSSMLSHVDLYRVEGAGQMEGLGMADLLRGPGIVLVEWGEKIEAELAAALQGALAYVKVTISLAADGGRDIVEEEMRP
jgi:tRNA threonylcarbamoyladenosine biosynthesis protein TsaE